MSLSRTKIDRNLSRAERQTLCAWLMERSANPTGPQVEMGLRELDLWEKAEEPSHASIADWLRKSYRIEQEAARLRESSHQAEALMRGVDPENLDQANRAQIQRQLFDVLLTLNTATDLHPDARAALVDSMGELVLASARLGKTSQAERALRAKLEELEAQKSAAAKALDAAEGERAVQPETIAELRKLLGLTA